MVVEMGPIRPRPATFGPTNDPTGGAGLFQATDVSDLLLAKSRDATCRLQSAAAPGGACDHVRGGMHRDQA
jgi:hypothetical protein